MYRKYLRNNTVCLEYLQVEKFPSTEDDVKVYSKLAWIEKMHMFSGSYGQCCISNMYQRDEFILLAMIIHIIWLLAINLTLNSE